MRVTEIPIPLFPGDDPLGQFEAVEDLNRARYEAGHANRAWLRTAREISASYSRRVIFTRHYYLLTDPAESNFDAPIAMLGPGSPAKILGYGYLRMAQQHRERATAWCDVVVHPESWGKGFGSFLLEEVARSAREKGAKQVVCRAYVPLESVLPTASEFMANPVPQFLARKGFSLVNIFEDYVWDVSDKQAIRENVASFLEVPGYRLVSWEGLTPAELLHGIASLRRNYTLGEQQAAFEQSRTDYWTAESLAREDQYNVAGGSPSFSTAALNVAGEVVGFTVLISHVDSPRRLVQAGTIVREESRGKGLGMALKAANLLSVLASHPQVRTVTTGIDPADVELVAVNARLGYVRVGMQGEFSKRI